MTRVLIVEDNELDQVYLRRCLESLGCDVTAVVPSGVEALAAVERDRPDIIFMDVMLLGDLDGIETTRRIENRFTVPVVFVSVGSAPSHETLGPRRLYLQKPLERDAVRAALEAALQRPPRIPGSQPAMDVLVLFDTERDQVSYASPSYETIFGDEIGALLASPLSWFRQVAPRHRSRVREAVVGNEPEVEFSIGSGEEERVIRARRFELGAGKRAFLAEDITALRRMQEALAVTQRRLGSLLSGGSVVTYAREPRDPFRLTFISENVIELLGYSPTRLYEEPSLWDRLVHPDDRPALQASARQPLRQGSSTLEYRMQHADGRWIWLLDERRCIEHGGPVEEIIGSLVDVTERRSLQLQLQQAQKMEALGLLAGGVAHDFNNLLTVILGYAELVLCQPLDPFVKESLEEIQSAGQRARGMVRQLLMFSRVDAGGTEIVDLNANVEGTARLIKPLIGEHIEVELDLDNRSPCILADPSHMQQILLNLCINARDAMPRGGVLTLRTVARGERVDLEVEDTGQGMEDRVLSRIFEPFFTTKGDRGTGLGLATVYRVVQNSRGTVDVESRPGQGTRFTISFPLAERVAPPSRPAPAEPGKGSETVLLVEDEDMIARLVSSVLTRAGYRVTVARDAREALERITPSLALLVTDVVLPGINGPELAEKVRRLRPAVRVLYMSGYGHENIADLGVRIEASQVLRKPFTAQVLLERVRAALDRSG